MAPRGWSCRAVYGADGSGGIVVFPTGETVPAGWGAGWRLSPDSRVEAVVGDQTSACAGCSSAQACPLFPAAAEDFSNQFGRPCPSTRPPAETVDRLGAGVTAFEDPPGIAGDGLPSGGRYPANGVMTYYRGNPNGSWRATCTLPPDQKDQCTAILDGFLSSYRTR